MVANKYVRNADVRGSPLDSQINHFGFSITVLPIITSKNPLTNLSQRLYAPYTNALLESSFPITSEIKLVAIFNIIDNPTP